MATPVSVNPHTDPDRREIWDILMREDFAGYGAVRRPAPNTPGFSAP